MVRQRQRAIKVIQILTDKADIISIYCPCQPTISLALNQATLTLVEIVDGTPARQATPPQE
jgi:hypothetical protein